MARRRDRKGRFVSRGRRRRRSRGMGSLITVRRALGGVRRRRRGGLFSFDMSMLMPIFVGGGVAAATALGIRYFIDPATGTTQQMLVRWANLFGLGVGALASALWMMIGGGGQASSAFLSAATVSLFGLANDFVLKERAAPILAAITSSGASMQLPTGTAGIGAIVPEYSNGMGALVMEQMGPGGQRPGSIGGLNSYGEVVSLQGVNVGAFGTAPFRS